MQELGLIGVDRAAGRAATFFGGSTERHLRDAETGKRVSDQRNKFVNVDRLLTLAKNTSFFAIMAIGATVVIVAGGIDLSVAGIYVLSGLAGRRSCTRSVRQVPGRACRASSLYLSRSPRVWRPVRCAGSSTASA